MTDSFNPDFNPDEFTTDLHKDLYEYWLKIKGNKLIPSRKDFDPLDIPHILSMLVLMNVTYDPLRFQVRLWGTENIKLSGKDITGIWVDEYQKKSSGKALEHLEKIITRFKWIVQNKRPYYVHTTMGWLKKGYRKYSSLVLPFSDDQERLNIILLANHYF